MNLPAFIGALLLTAVFYTALALFFKSGPSYAFFAGRGWYQPASVTLFFFGLLLVAYRWWMFNPELASADMPIPNDVIPRENAAALASQLPEQYRDTMLGQRLSKLLNGYARREPVGDLHGRLALIDREELEDSASLLGWVRSLPPAIGLLGTLNGLRGGIADIATISKTGDIEDLRRAMQSFAGHASMAFDTTLLGIGAAVILSALIFLVRRSENNHLARVDRIAEELARQFPHRSELEDELRATANGFMAGFLETMQHGMTAAVGPMVNAFRNEIHDELARASKIPEYEIDR
ncbi:MAG: MotA/TolQ/ExbB proton channel family protein [Acidobacteriota bacterium]|nr:MotA/TolQ/ExbB proton channel family protein [Acidobacteriota bacterium]